MNSIFVLVESWSGEDYVFPGAGFNLTGCATLASGIQQLLNQCCGAATFLGGSVSGSLRSRLRPNWVGSGSRQKKAAPAPYTLITFTVINCSKSCYFVTTSSLSVFACQKMQPEPSWKSRLSAPANKKIGSGSTLKVAALQHRTELPIFQLERY